MASGRVPKMVNILSFCILIRLDTFSPDTDNAEIYKAFMVAVTENNEWIKYQSSDDLSEDSSTDTAEKTGGPSEDEDFDI